MAEDMGEKTEDATPRKLNEARSRGQVVKSMDLAGAIDLIGAVLLLVAFGSYFAGNLRAIMLISLQPDQRSEWITFSAVESLLRRIAMLGLSATIPLMLLMFAIAALANIVQFGWLWSTDALMPKLERLDPVKGVGRLMSLRSLMKTLINTVKLVVVLGVAYLVMSRDLDRIVSLPGLSAAGALLMIAKLAVELALWLLAAMLVIGVADFVYQKWQFRRDMKMTKQEVEDERRSMDGDPKVKAKRFRMMRDIIFQQNRATVPTADVVVTNPTHFSVAIKYDEATMRAPRVVAKGADQAAMYIRQIARANDVPIVERPPLARALYYGVEIGREVPPEQYEAVAELLAYVYRLERAAAA
jgi:flagellar biosynthetic protein FlhB